MSATGGFGRNIPTTKDESDDSSPLLGSLFQRAYLQAGCGLFDKCSNAVFAGAHISACQYPCRNPTAPFTVLLVIAKVPKMAWTGMLVSKGLEWMALLAYPALVYATVGA